MLLQIQLSGHADTKIQGVISMKNKKMKKIGATLSSSVAALSMMLMNAVSASADAIDVNDNGKAAVVLADLSGLLKWINDLGDTAKYIGYAISVLAVIIAGIMLIGGGNGGMSKTKGVFIGILGGLAILGFGPAIIQDFQAATSSGMLFIK